MLTLVALRLTSLKNRLFSRKESIFFIIFFLLILSAFLINFREMSETEGLAPDSPDTLLLLHHYFMILFTLFFIGSLSASLNLLFFSKDMSFLVTFPISASSLVTGKFLEAFILEINFTFLFLLPLVGSILISIRIPGMVAPVIITSLLSTFVLAFGIGAVISLAILILLPGRKGKSLGRLTISLVGILIWILIFKSNDNGSAFIHTEKSIQDISRLNPFLWGGDFIFSYINGNYFTSLIFLLLQTLSGLLTAMTSGFIAVKMLRTRGVTEEIETESVPAGKNHSDSPIKLPRIWDRNFKLILRNTPILTPLGTLAVMASLSPILAGGESSQLMLHDHILTLPLFTLILLWILLFQTGSILPPAEGPGVWIFRVVPVNYYHIVSGKILTGLVPGTIAFLLAHLVYFKHFPDKFEITGFIFLGASIVSTGVHLGYRWGNFEWETYREMLPQTLGFLAGVIILVIVAAFELAVYIVMPAASQMTMYLTEQGYILIVWLLISAIVTIINSAFSANIMAKKNL